MNQSKLKLKYALGPVTPTCVIVPDSPPVNRTSADGFSECCATSFPVTDALNVKAFGYLLKRNADFQLMQSIH